MCYFIHNFINLSTFNLTNYMDSSIVNGCKRTNKGDCYFRQWLSDEANCLMCNNFQAHVITNMLRV